MTTKANAIASALAAIAAQFQKTAEVYGRLDSQEADFRSLKQQADAALAMPDDPAPDAPPPPPPPPADYAPVLADLTDKLVAVSGTLGAVSEKLNGMEDVLGVIVAGIPAPAPQ
ncbi:hypothetical protein [Pseudoduganella sp. UC29_71]|uniref:hypothetical protein n=1 Tax=Pseudoduganella sp. UC29_71 TaxID=3350174 RepID=UPI0036711503